MNVEWYGPKIRLLIWLIVEAHLSYSVLIYNYEYNNVNRYSFEGVLQAIYGYDRADLDCDPENPLKCLFHDPDMILRELDVDKANLLVDVAIMCAYFFVLRIVCYFVLRWRVAQRWTIHSHAPWPGHAPMHVAYTECYLQHRAIACRSYVHHVGRSYTLVSLSLIARRSFSFLIPQFYPLGRLITC